MFCRRAANVKSGEPERLFAGSSRTHDVVQKPADIILHASTRIATIVEKAMSATVPLGNSESAGISESKQMLSKMRIGLICTV